MRAKEIFDKSQEHNTIRRVSINIPFFEESNIEYEDLKVHQKMLGHGVFKFLWKISPTLITNPLMDFGYFQEYLDSDVLFTFYDTKGKAFYFKGLIKSLKMINKDGATRGFMVKGATHTINLEGAPSSKQYLDKTLKEIICDTLEGHKMDVYDKANINPVYTRRINILRSNETDFQFINRLLKRYGEWGYFNGQTFIIGALSSSETILKNGTDLRRWTMKTKLINNSFKLSGYDYNRTLAVDSALDQTDNHFNDELMLTAIEMQGSQYPVITENDNYSPLVHSREKAIEMTRLQASGNASKMITYKALTRELTQLGSIIKIENKTVSHHLIVTESIFHSVGYGHIENKFKAIPVDCLQPPYTNVLEKGFAYDQPAIVFDNNDPKGMGRVRVRYFWNTKSGDNESDWLRLKTQYAGNDKGIYFIPEIDEEVFVSFQGNDPDAAYVSGVNYNGENVSGYATQGNDMKVIQTRSGIKILYNDADGSLTIEDPSGNLWFMDGKGNIVVTAPNNMTFNVGKNFNINVGQDMVTQIGGNKTLNVIKEIQLLANTFKETVESNKNVKIGGDLQEETNKTTHISIGDILYHSEGYASFYGNKSSKVNQNK